MYTWSPGDCGDGASIHCSCFALCVRDLGVSKLDRSKCRGTYYDRYSHLMPGTQEAARSEGSDEFSVRLDQHGEDTVTSQLAYSTELYPCSIGLKCSEQIRSGRCCSLPPTGEKELRTHAPQNMRRR